MTMAAGGEELMKLLHQEVGSGGSTAGGKVLCDLLGQVMAEHPANCTSCKGYKPGAFERITSMPEWAVLVRAMEDEEDRYEDIAA